MKRCPTCRRTYPDDAQKFCLQDGTPLVADAPQPSQDVPPTMRLPTPPPPPQASWSTRPPHPPPGAPKRKIWPWVLGGLGVLVVGGVLLATVIGYALYKLADTNNATSRVGTNTSTNTSDEEPVVDISNTELFVNSRDKAKGVLATNYVDFSFRYPKTWKLDPEPAPSFARVERSNDAGNPVEDFSVGWFTVVGTGTDTFNTAMLSKTINDLSKQISGSFPDYSKIGEGATTVGRYRGYELRFSGAANKGTARALPFWGRIVILPDPNGGRHGVSLIMLATGHSKEIKSQADLGEKGDLPVILKTFRMGPTPGATSTSGASTNANANASDDEEEETQ